MSYLIEMNTVSEDANMDRLGGRFSALSPNLSRELLIYSDLLSQLYANRMEVENKKLFWNRQV